MSPNLPVEILCEILNKLVLQDDIKTLFTCLFINKLWCQITVPILWRDPWKFKIWDTSSSKDRYKLMLNILILFLSDDIKSLIIQPKYSFRRTIDYNTSTLFNYPSFCKNFSIHHINKMVNLSKYQHNNDQKELIIKEILKLFVSESTHFLYMHIEDTKYDIISLFSNDKTFLQITELIIGENVDSLILQRLSQLCQNIKRLNLIEIDYSNQGMIDLVKVQNNLNYLKFSSKNINKKKTKQVISLGNILKLTSQSIISLNFENELQIILDILPHLTQNLRELNFKVDNIKNKLVNRFYLELESIKFEQLEILKCNLPFKLFAKVIEKSGSELKKLIHEKGSYTSNEIGFLINAISSNCFKLEYLHIEIKNIDDLLKLLNFCQDLKVLKLNLIYFNIKNQLIFLETLAKKSPQSLYKLQLNKDITPELFEKFLEIWQKRPNMKSLHLNIISYYFNNKEKIVKKFKTNGVLSKFKYGININEY
jgi:hypothetical protein